MKLIMHPELESLKHEFSVIASQVLAAARLRRATRGRTVFVTPYGRHSKGGACYPYKVRGQHVRADAKVVYKESRHQYYSHRRQRCMFIVQNLTPLQVWALSLAHEAEHVRQSAKWRAALRAGKLGGRRRQFSEVEADRAALRAATKLGWGDIVIYRGGLK